MFWCSLCMTCCWSGRSRSDHVRSDFVWDLSRRCLILVNLDLILKSPPHFVFRIFSCTRTIPRSIRHQSRSKVSFQRPQSQGIWLCGYIRRHRVPRRPLTSTQHPQLIQICSPLFFWLSSNWSFQSFNICQYFLSSMEMSFPPWAFKEVFDLVLPPPSAILMHSY